MKARYQGTDIYYHMQADESISPNNTLLPVVAYQGAVKLPRSDPAPVLENLFTANLWPSAWRNGVFGFHHYHSTAHKVWKGSTQ
jgi:uncharacterized protein YjlB